MMLYLPFEGGSNSTYTKDYSGYGNDGTVTGATWNRTGGKTGGAYSFDGTDDAINVSDSDSVSIVSAISIEAWIKQNIVGSHNTVVSKSHEYLLRINNITEEAAQQRKLDCFVYLDGTFEPRVSSTEPINDSNWHHVVCTWDGSTGNLSIYLDGKLNNTRTGRTGAVTGTSDDLQIGNWNDDVLEVTSYFNGTIDEVKIYNFSMSAEQVYENYLAGSSGINPNILSGETILVF